MSAARRRAGGFTLIEVLGVILLTTLLLSVALDFYIDLSSQSARASENTRAVRRASAILDRVASDLEQALLVRKPDETDPLDHPWVFVADSRYAEQGADRVKFDMRQPPRSSDGNLADLFQVAYVLWPSEEGHGYELRRWSRPGLPEKLDREFPLPGDPDALLLVDGLERFELQFLNEDGEWVSSWDSSQLVESSELPVAVRIELALASPDGETQETFPPGTEPLVYSRQVQLPVRPLDLAVLLDPKTYAAGSQSGESDEEGKGCRTIADCVDVSRLTPEDLQKFGPILSQAEDTCFEPYRSFVPNHPAVDPSCL